MADNQLATGVVGSDMTAGRDGYGSGPESNGREPRWLNGTQQTAWRAFLTLHSRLFAEMNRDLQRSAGLSLSDYEVLVHLTDVDGDRQRSHDLARSLDWEKSRLSKQVARMEKRGLVALENVAEDRRGRWVVLTAEGRRVIEGAAPDHVNLVHRLMFDGLTPEQEEALAGILPDVVDHIESELTDGGENGEER